MSVYKVPQDVEAEDKLIGPFTLKQFIFLIVAAIAGYITFILATTSPVFTIITIPVVLVFGILGIYRRSDQPVEIYLASLIRFYLKPRLRIWDQDGIMEPVHITVPPKVEHRYTDGRSAGQVNSQLKNLANMMDTRGWSSKNASVQSPGQPGSMPPISSGDRLVTRQDLPIVSQPSEVHLADDMLDYRNNSVAQTMSSLAQGSTVNARQNAIATMQNPTPIANPTPAPVQRRPSPQAQPQPQQSASTMTQQASPDIIRLSQNSDFNVSTLARQAEQDDHALEDDTEISLH